MSPAFLDALLAGRRNEAEAAAGFKVPDAWPDAHDRRFLALRIKQMRDRPETQEWFVRALVLPDGDRPMIGHAGFHGPPGTNSLKAPEAVEVGYTVFPEYRRRGFASEAAQALIDWAVTERGIRLFIASVGPQNEPSLRLVGTLGFEEAGRHWDEEDGEELEFELRIG